MAYPYTPPDFLQNQSADTIHRRMLAALPNDIDKSELQIPWDFTRPAAIEKAEFIQFELNETVKLIFPHWAYRQWLDLHAQREGLIRRAANKATGTLTVVGKDGLVVEQGFQFATQANLTASVIFETTEEVTLGNGEYTIMDAGLTPEAVIKLTLNAPSQKPLHITLLPATDTPDTGLLTLWSDATQMEQISFDISDGADQVTSLVDAAGASAYFTLTKLADSAKSLHIIERGFIGTPIPVQAIEGGRVGNVPSDTIILMVKPDSNIAYVTNAEATTGGAPEESDDELRERILEVIRRGISWTGCDADYVRWAKEVPGVGNAVTQAEWAGPGTVRVFVIDANGLPANQQILDAVYTYIIHPENRMERKAPIGATLTVAAPTPLYIDVTARVTLESGENLGTVTDRYKMGLNQYWLQASSENDLYDVYTGNAQNYIKYVYVGAALAETAGIDNYDHGTLLVNGSTADILIDFGLFPVTGVVNLYE